MRHNLGINTDIFETNILNLLVVISIVVTVIGDAVGQLLDRRKKRIVEQTKLADTTASRIQEYRLRASRARSSAVRSRAKIRASGMVQKEQEETKAHKQLKEELQRLQGAHEIMKTQLRYRKVKFLQDRIVSRAIRVTEDRLRGRRAIGNKSR